VFLRIVDWTVRWAGSPFAVLMSFVLVGVWAAFGPYYQWSEQHQLWINTSTTIITFELCFLILSAQNRDTLALHTKLDALIKASEASNALIALESKTEAEIEAARAKEVGGGEQG
jgi:low affinity Fe/Cu permease